MPRRRRKSRPAESILDRLLDPLDLLGLAWAALGGQLGRIWQAWRTQRAVKVFSLVLLAALGLRLMRPEWYSHRTFHPDERWIFDRTSELSWPGEPGRNDPAGMQYGSLPLYSVALVKDVLVHSTHLSPYDASIVAGRTVTGLVDTLSVVGTFLLGLALLGAWPAVLASLLVACAPLHIQLAHFFTVDPWLTAMVTLTLAVSAAAAKRPSVKRSVVAGALYGLALASKTSGLPLVLGIVLAHLWGPLTPGLPAKERSRQLRGAFKLLGIAAIATLAAFFVAMPWAFLDFAKFYANQTAQQAILVTGSPTGVPFVRQYWDTTPWFHLKNVAVFYLGLPIGPLALLAALLALVSGLWSAWAAWAMPAARPSRRPSPDSPALRWHLAFAPLLLLAWVLPYFAIVGFSFAKFARYMLPLLPELALLLAGLVAWITMRSRALGLGLAALLAVAAIGHGIGYANTYRQDHPWVEASQWIYQNVPSRVDDATAPGGSRMARILNEDWGDDLPVEVNGQVISRYDSLKGRPDQLNIVEWDSPQKLSRMAHSLSQADLIVLADPRGYGTYLRLPTRFPLSHAYYDLLFHNPGRLGFKLAHESSDPIKVFGWSLPDSRIPDVPRWLWADESFTLYDRPHAFLFTRVSPITDEAAGQVLRDRVHELGLSDGWLQGMGPEELDRAAKGGASGIAGTPVAVATDAGPANPNFGLSRGSMIPLLNPVLAWWLLVAVLGWLALPLCLKLFGSFPAGGYALGRALGVLLFGWLAYNLAWAGAVPFTQGGLWMLLAFLSMLLALGIRERRHSVVAWAKANRSEILFTEGVFAAAFIGFVLVRAFNPNIHDITGQGYFGGGEPLGMTYLSAISRCVRFPAYDPWLAGQNSSYYYFGYVLAAALTKLSGYPPAITYSLSLALFFSLTTVTAFGLLRGLVGRRWAALGGAAMVSMAGSLWTVAYLAIQTVRGSGILGAWFSHGFIWDPTRFPELVNGHIFEFPYFSYLYGDLHPHNIVLGFSLLLLALLLVPFLSREGGWRSVGASPKLAALWLLVTALVLDSQYAINTWSWPVFVALGFGCFVFGPWAGKGGSVLDRVLNAGFGAVAWAVALVLGRILMFGFRHYYLQNGGNRVGVVQPNEWQMSAYIPLAFFLPGLVALALLGGDRLRAWAPAQGAKLGWQRLARREWWDRWLSMGERMFDLRPVFSAAATGWLLLVAVLLGWSFIQFDSHGVWAVALGLGLACVGLFCLGAWNSGRETWLWILGAFTCFLVAGAEHWFVADRMNTIFKFWMNGWILMGVVFGAGLAMALDQPAAAAVRASRKRVTAKAKGRRGSRARRPSWLKRAAQWLWALLAGGPGQRPVRRWSIAGLLLLVAGAAWLDAHGLSHGGRFMVSYLAFAALLLGLLLGGALHGGKPWWGRLRQGVLLGLLGLGLLYPVGATVERIIEACDHDYTHPHLDGLAFMAQRPQRAEYDAKDYDQHDFTLIQWLNKNAPVTETLLEAPGTELYKGYSRYAIYTGLPTLVGWDYQVSQQLGERTGNILSQRERDASVMYGADDAAALALLHQYKVRWIVVGGIERKMYPAAGLDKFAHLAAIAVQDGPSILYRFDWDKP